MSFTPGIYDDINVSGLSFTNGASAPSLTTLVGGVKVLAYAIGNIVHGTLELLHGYKEGTDLRFHIHTSPNTTNVGQHVFTLEYALANAGAVLASTTTITANTTTTGVALIHQLVEFAPVIPGAGLKIGAIIDFTLSRINTGNTFTGDVFVHSVGIHYQKDGLGSNQVATKN